MTYCFICLLYPSGGLCRVHACLNKAMCTSTHLVASRFNGLAGLPDQESAYSNMFTCLLHPFNGLCRLQACLTKNPQQRPTARALMDHPWLAEQQQNAERRAASEVEPEDDSKSIFATMAEAVAPVWGRIATAKNVAVNALSKTLTFKPSRKVHPEGRRSKETTDEESALPPPASLRA